MTNAEIIQAIKAEIERRIRSIENCPFIEAEFGASEKREGKLTAYKELLSFLSTLESEKPSERLEEEISRYLREECSNDDEPSISEVARHFAEWQREQDEKEQADLFTIVALDAAQRAKEQIMKGAVNTVVSLDAGGFPFVEFGVGKFGLKVGDKVRIIIIKEDEK